MKHSRNNTSLLILTLLAAFGITALATLRGQSQNNSTSRHQGSLKKAAEDFYTMTDYAAPEPTEPQKRGLRRVRAKRYNMRAQKGVDPRHFRITEERESSFGSPSSHAPIEPALPAAQSDTVVIGEVTEAEAFLSEDKTSISSEFRISVFEILKNNMTAAITIGDLIDTIRGGGAVRFPSGKVVREGFHGKPLPRIGKRYLFFLKGSSDGGKDFVILTAYELRAGKVLPLDGVELDGRITPQYAAYQKYKGVDEAAFLSEVRAAISALEGK